jgi:hypothetical protein
MKLRPLILSQDHTPKSGAMHQKIWLKRVLISFWVIDFLWLVAVIAFAGVDLKYYEVNYDDGNNATYYEAFE